MKDKNEVTNFPDDDNELDPEEEHNVIDFDELSDDDDDKKEKEKEKVY